VADLHIRGKEKFRSVARLAIQPVIHIATLPDAIWRYGSGGNWPVGREFRSFLPQ
jgi:hypothetical protein